jgi:hypothetical protein
VNKLPVVTVTRVAGGFEATCSACPWSRFDTDRPTVDLVARRHRASHGKGH